MVERGGVDDRTAPIFFAAAAGKPACTLHLHMAKLSDTAY